MFPPSDRRAIDAGASRSMTAIRASKPVAVALQASSLR